MSAEPNPNFGQNLEKIRNLFNTTKPQSQDTIPNGVYQFKIESAELNQYPDKNDKSVMIPTVVMKFRCLSEAFAKKVLTSFDRLQTEESISFFKEKMRRLGLDPNTDIMQLELVLKDLVGTLVTAKVDNKPGSQGDRIFTNIYIRSNDGRDNTVPV